MAMPGATAGSAAIHLPQAAAGSAGTGTAVANTDATQGGFHAVLEDHVGRDKGTRSRDNATGARRQENPRSKADDGRVAVALGTPIAVPAQTFAGLPTLGLTGRTAEDDSSGLDLTGADGGSSATESNLSGGGSSTAGATLPTSGTQAAVAPSVSGLDPVCIPTPTASSPRASGEEPAGRGQVSQVSDSQKQGDAGAAAELPTASPIATPVGSPLAPGVLITPVNAGATAGASVAVEQVSNTTTVGSVGRAPAAKQAGALGRSTGSARQSMQHASSRAEAMTSTADGKDAAAGGGSLLSATRTSEAGDGSGSDSGSDGTGQRRETEASFDAQSALAGLAANTPGAAAVPVPAAQPAMAQVTAGSTHPDAGHTGAGAGTAGTPSGATAWSASGDPSIQAGQASPMSQVEVARLMRTSAGSELRVGIRSEDFGSVTIHTLLGRDQVSAQISVENGRLSSALSSHLATMQGALEDRLGQGLGVRASVTMGDASSAGASSFGNGGYGQGAGSGQSNGSGDQPRPQTLFSGGGPSRPAQGSSASGVSAAPSLYPAERSRLDIRI